MPEKIIEDTGIYQLTAEPVVEAIHRAHTIPKKDRKWPLPFVDELPRIEQELCRIIGDCAVATLPRPIGVHPKGSCPSKSDRKSVVEWLTKHKPPPGRLVAFGDKVFVIPNDAPVEIRRAADALISLDHVCHAMNRNDLRGSVEALHVGRDLEILGVTPHEPDAERGKNNRRSTAKGGDTRGEQLKGASELLGEEIRAKFKHYMRMHPNADKTPAVIDLSIENGWPEATIWKHLKPLSKKSTLRS